MTRQFASRFARPSYDDAVAESFFATIKKELIQRRSWPSRRELIGEVFEYIEAFNTPVRRHSALGYLSPEQFEDVHPHQVEKITANHPCPSKQRHSARPAKQGTTRAST